MKDRNDNFRFLDTDYISVVGYITETKSGGAESCNCNSEDEKDHAIHIYIGKNVTDDKIKCFIA